MARPRDAFKVVSGILILLWVGTVGVLWGIASAKSVFAKTPGGLADIPTGLVVLVAAVVVATGWDRRHG